MGKIKTRLIKRTGETLVENKEIEFTDKFEDNKKILGKTMPSKKIRNQIAGYIARMKTQEAKRLAK